VKMLILAAAGLNMAAFHASSTFRTIDDWGGDPQTPRAAKVAGGLSLLLWISVVSFGRWIGFV
jgi:hypothetical protein